MTDKSTIRQAVREALRTAEKSRYRIAKETGLSETALGLFLHGHRGMTLDRLEYLADYLNLEIIIRPKDGKDTDHHG